MTASPVELLLYEIKALRADIQALPDQIVSAASKKIEHELMQLWWFLVLLGLAYGVWHEQWVPVAWSGGCLVLYLLLKRVFRKRLK